MNPKSGLKERKRVQKNRKKERIIDRAKDIETKEDIPVWERQRVGRLVFGEPIKGVPVKGSPEKGTTK